MGFKKTDSQMRYEVELSELADWAGQEGDPWSVRHKVDAWAERACGIADIDRLYVLLECVTGGTFTSAYGMLRGFHQVKDFFRVVKSCYEDRLNGTRIWEGPEGSSPWNDPKEVERFMSEVLDVCKRSRVWYHPGWLLCLTKVRSTINAKAYRQPRDDFDRVPQELRQARPSRRAYEAERKARG
jgi:hypothetical protein